MSNDTERWLPVVGYEGYYEVSDLGRVRSLDRVIRYRTGRCEHRPGRVLKPWLTPGGRRSVHLYKNLKSSPTTIYSLVLAAFSGPRPVGQEACHNNGDKTDDRLVNLRWDTKSANTLDMVAHGVHHAARRTRCSRGHVLAEPNLVAFRLRRGERACLACDRAKLNRQYARKQGRDFDLAAVADRHYATIMEGVSVALHESSGSQAG